MCGSYTMMGGHTPRTYSPSADALYQAPIEVLRMGIFSGYFRLAAAMFEGSNVQWRLRKSAFRIAVQLRRQLYSKLFAYYKRTNTCVKIC